MTTIKSRKIQSTRNYGLFARNDLNRDVKEKTHRKLFNSMRKHGFLWFCPILCKRDESGNLYVWDGQHRLAFAQTLGLEVWWIEIDGDCPVDLPEFNGTPEKWMLRDFAETYARNGIASYRTGLDFAAQHGINIGTAFAMLAGTTSFGNTSNAFCEGRFVVRDRAWADQVAGVYAPMVRLSRALKNARFLLACMAVCRVEGFDVERLLKNAARCREKLVNYATRDAYLQMIEDIYNFGRSRMMALKVPAEAVMRERVVCRKAQKKTATVAGH